MVYPLINTNCSRGLSGTSIKRCYPSPAVTSFLYTAVNEASFNTVTLRTFSALVFLSLSTVSHGFTTDAVALATLRHQSSTPYNASRMFGLVFASIGAQFILPVWV